MLELIGIDVYTFNKILISIGLALSIYLTLSAGLLSLASIGFMAIGAYSAALLLAQTSLPLAAGFGLGILLAGLVALPLGLLVLRLRHVYLAIATLGFGEIVRLLVLNGDKLARGLSGDQSLEIFYGAEGITLPYVSPTTVLGVQDQAWPMLIYVLLLIYLLAMLQRSHYGRVLSALRQDETAAATLGVNLLRYKLALFVLSAMVAAGTGALSVLLVRPIVPANYVFGEAVGGLASAVLGGTTHWLGPLVGAFLLTSLPELLRFLQEQREVINGLIIMVAIIYLPRGLVDPRFWSRLWRRLGRAHG